MKLDPKIQQRKRTPMLPPKPELIEIDYVLPKVGVTKQDFQEWKPKPSREER